MSSTVEQIKERLSIEEVVSQYVKLAPAGQNLKARCPFHNERTPSFMVSRARQTYHCFGCSAGGDIFSFVEAVEGVDFKGALKILADKAGVEIKYNKKSREKSNKKEELFEIMEVVARFYEENFKKNKEVQSYLKERGLDDKVIKEFRIGFAKDSWDDLLTYLKRERFDERVAEQAGLIIKSEKKVGYYDRFRSRVMFPISDSAGRIVAFSGRIFSCSSAKKGVEVAKYINSPETLLYNKSKVLYGYDYAKQAIRRNDFAILVEGQMDLLASHQAGYPNTVAISGTALTTEHVTLLSRMSKNLVLALDADSAGLSSARKSAQMALQSGFDVKVVKLPRGSDPADIIKEKGGTKKWKEIIRNSKHIIEFLLDVYKEKDVDERRFKLLVEKEVVPYLHLIQSPIDKEHFLKKIAERLGTSERSIADSLARSTNSVSGIPSAIQSKDAEQVEKKESTAGFAERLVSIYIWKKEEDLKKKIINTIGEDKFNTVMDDLRDRQGLVFVLEEIYEDDKKLASDTESFLWYLKRDILQSKLAQVTLKMREAEDANKEQLVVKYMNECKELHKQLGSV